MALVGAAVVGITALSLAKVYSLSMNSMKANTIALQAYQYADAEAQLVRATDYASLSSKAKADIQNSNGFQREITLSAESAYSDTVKQKIATVKIYRSGETTPRISLDVKRLSKEVKADSVPSGTILPWYGALGSIPTGYALCNGSNGTPDLRNRFLVGAGDSYDLSAVGGTSHVQLSWNEMPSHSHTRGSMNITGVLNIPNGADVPYPSYYAAGGSFYCNGSATLRGNAGDHGVGGRLYFDASRTWTGETSWAGSNYAHENRPPYYAVYYIMKL